jgi:hypothetical protein
MPHRPTALALVTLAMAAGLVACLPAEPTAQSGAVSVTVPSGSRPGLALSIMPVGPSTLSYGETVGFRLMSVAGGFGHLYVIDDTGAVQAWAENLPLHPGESLDYPVAGSGLRLRAAPPAGNDHVIFLATLHRFSGFIESDLRTVVQPVTLPYRAAEFRRQLDAVTNSLPNRSWGRSEIEIRVVDPAAPAG